MRDLTVSYVPHPRGCRRGDLVQTIVGMYDDCALHLPRLENLGKEVPERLRRDPRHLVVNVRWVHERADDVENSAHTQALARSSDILHAGVNLLGEEKSESAFFDNCGCFRGFQVNGCPKSLQEIGTSALATRRAVAMLCDKGTAGGDDHATCRRNVERVRPVASGAHDIAKGNADRSFYVTRRGVLGHDLGRLRHELVGEAFDGE
mmetsp:Transcript_11420/g.32076  ORF Transcript_11420/g.32076 Transcript_11420/m.32076 type:complete len:206 (-) Transcript_11420:577-1194(-)